MTMHIDYGVSEDCINIHSYGMICVHCGCCSYNPNFRDRTRRQINYYKRMLVEEYNFSNWFEDTKWRALQEKNVKANITYFKRKIRRLKKIMKTLKGGAE